MALPDRQRSRTMTTWDPVDEIERAARQMAQLAEQAFRRVPQLAEDSAFTPFADLAETEDAYVLEVELPGMRKKDIDVECRGRRITISGERVEKERDGVLRKRTRSVGRFFHEVVVPGEIDDDGITASLEDGVLTVRAPKAESEKKQTRRIEIG